MRGNNINFATSITLKKLIANKTKDLVKNIDLQKRNKLK